MLVVDKIETRKYPVTGFQDISWSQFLLRTIKRSVKQGVTYTFQPSWRDKRESPEAVKYTSLGESREVRNNNISGVMTEGFLEKGRFELGVEKQL